MELAKEHKCVRMRQLGFLKTSLCYKGKVTATGLSQQPKHRSQVQMTKWQLTGEMYM